MEMFPNSVVADRTRTPTSHLQCTHLCVRLWPAVALANWGRRVGGGREREERGERDRHREKERDRQTDGRTELGGRGVIFVSKEQRIRQM